MPCRTDGQSSGCAKPGTRPGPGAHGARRLRRRRGASIAPATTAYPSAWSASARLSHRPWSTGRAPRHVAERCRRRRAAARRPPRSARRRSPARRTRRGARRRGRARSRSGRAASAPAPRSRARRSRRAPPGPGARVRIPSQTIALPRSSSQWYEAAMSAPHVAAPTFSTSALAVVSAPARGGSSDHERQRATSGPGTRQSRPCRARPGSVTGSDPY